MSGGGVDWGGCVAAIRAKANPYREHKRRYGTPKQGNSVCPRCPPEKEHKPALSFFDDGFKCHRCGVGGDVAGYVAFVAGVEGIEDGLSVLAAAFAPPVYVALNRGNIIGPQKPGTRGPRRERTDGDKGPKWHASPTPDRKRAHWLVRAGAYAAAVTVRDVDDDAADRAFLHERLRRACALSGVDLFAADPPAGMDVNGLLQSHGADAVRAMLDGAARLHTFDGLAAGL